MDLMKKMVLTVQKISTEINVLGLPLLQSNLRSCMINTYLIQTQQERC